jgi:hypothetical protein
LENNKDSKGALIPKYNTSIRFLSKTKNDKDIQDATILNLYFIIRKKMNETFNNNIHNKILKLYYFARVELDKYENEK